MNQVSPENSQGTGSQPVSPDFQIDQWIEEDQRRYLVSFMQAVDDLPLDVVLDAIRTACQRGFGLWMEPPKGDAAKSLRPATHLIEISLFGVTGCGLTMLEATQSWRLAARRVLEQADAA